MLPFTVSCCLVLSHVILKNTVLSSGILSVQRALPGAAIGRSGEDARRQGGADTHLLLGIDDALEHLVRRWTRRRSRHGSGDWDAFAAHAAVECLTAAFCKVTLILDLVYAFPGLDGQLAQPCLQAAGQLRPSLAIFV